MRTDNRGFTIVELMIAATIFSVVLVVVASVTTQMAEQFNRGINKAKTQNVVREVSEEIANNIKFSASAIPDQPSTNGRISAWCIADRLYAFRTDRLVRNVNDDGGMLRIGECGLPPGALTAGPDRPQLLGMGMRVVNLAITPVDDQRRVWQVTLRVALGEDDMLCSPTGAPNECTSPGVGTLTNTDLVCKPLAGSQFCAVAEHSIIVARRL